MPFLPTIDEVAALLHARTKDANGNSGTFNADTIPTDTQVEALIQTAADKVALRIGDNPADSLLPAAKDVVVLGTAMLIELSYFPEQVRADTSPYRELKTLYDEALEQLVLAKVDLGADQEPGTDDDRRAGTAVFGFPSGGYIHAPGSEIPATGWSTEW